MKTSKESGSAAGLGTAPVYITSISTILGAILFLRFGFATGTLGFWGAMIIILLGHLITIPTALAISEIATNTRVEGGGEYFIISRSFGLKIGSTIGVALYFSQAISVAFYVIAFTEAFTPLFNWWEGNFNFELPRQVISIPALCILAYIILKKGTGSGMKMLYVITAILIVSLILFFLGSPTEPGNDSTYVQGNNFGFFNKDKLFLIFAICFPAFTGMTAGVGLSGDLRNPGKSIPLGTMGGTITGLVVYAFVVWKFAVSAPQADLIADQLIMTDIAIFGAVMIPIGLAACTISSAMASAMVAPRTLQALASDKSLPLRGINNFLSRGKGNAREPFNASIVTFVVASVFVVLGDVNIVAQVISMFFLVTYGSLCLISFLNHFGSPPSYRPRFKSKWYLSLGGFILSVWIMFKINAVYTIISSLIIIVLYLIIEHYNKDQKGLVNIFTGALFQLNRRLQVFMQKNLPNDESSEWRPAAICISPNSFERDKVLDLMRWISYKHGFGTYFHFIEGYFSKQTFTESQKIQARLIVNQKDRKNTLYIDTMISPSYTSAIAQVIQSPSISGMENNMVIFEFDKSHPEEIGRILDNIKLTKAGNFDVCIFGSAAISIKFKYGIHVWLRKNIDVENANLMILLGYIIMSHPDWSKGEIKIFSINSPGREKEAKKELEVIIDTGRLPITLTNIEIVTPPENEPLHETVTRYSQNAGLTMIGFRDELLKYDGSNDFFDDFGGIGDILFVNAAKSKTII